MRNADLTPVRPRSPPSRPHWSRDQYVDAIDHDAFARAIRGKSLSPKKTANKPGRRRLWLSPLGSLLDTLEAQCLASSPLKSSPTKRLSPPLKPLAHPPSVPQLSQTPSAPRLQVSRTPQKLKRVVSEPVFVPKAEAASASSDPLAPHVRRHVHKLFLSFADSGQQLRFRNDDTPSSASSMPRSKSTSSLGRSLAPAAVSGAAACNMSFEGLLKMYYPGASASDRATMLGLVEPRWLAMQRRGWVDRVKTEHSDKIKMAFIMGDKDGDGTLSLSEFADAIKLHRGAKQRRDAAEGQQSSCGAVISDEEIAAMFEHGDKDGSGTLDVDEFLALVASQPKLLSSFEDILKHGVQRRVRLEERKLKMLFSAVLSPTARGRGKGIVVSPSGRRRRPTLLDLRPRDEVRMSKLRD